jgi:hypothetical protein
MVYNTQNYLVFGLCPSSGILENRKHDVSETGCVSVLRWRGKTPTQLGPLKKPISINERKEIQFPKRRVFYLLNYRTMEEVQKPSNSV